MSQTAPLPLIITVVVAVGIALGISIPLTSSGSDTSNSTNSSNWEALGAIFGGNTAAMTAPHNQSLLTFPVHVPGETHFITEHRCAGICSTDYSATGTNERALSNSIFAQTVSIPDTRGLGLLAVIFGQLFDHDVTRVETDEAATPTFSVDMSDLGADPLIIKRTQVEIGESDSCRNPVMHITPYIDGTPFYSDYLDPERAAKLRSYTAGQMRVTPTGYLPRNPESPNEFLAGDVRATEHAVLAMFHTVFVRQHNDVAGRMHVAQLGLADEPLFWKARRLVVAQFQRIVYEEWLPALLGSQYDASALGIDGVAAACSAELPVSGTTLLKTDFSQAAYRFGHSMVPNNVGPYALTDLFFNATKVEEIGIDALVSASVATPAESADAKVVDGLRNMLFGTHGIDLVAFNIARGREIGVASYADTRECYGLEGGSSPGTDSNLYIRTQQEPLVAGSSLGRTTGHIILNQMLDLCRADPFFYTRLQTKIDIGLNFYPWVTDATLKGILVNNTDVDPASIPDNAFYASV